MAGFKDVLGKAQSWTNLDVGVEKAILEIEDQRKVQKKLDTKIVDLKIKQADLKSKGLADSPVGKAAAKDLKKMSGVVGQADAIMNAKREDISYWRYEVLFNPKEVHLTGRGQAMVPMNDFSEGVGIKYQTRDPNLELRIPLIVDRTLANRITTGITVPGINADMIDGAFALIDTFTGSREDGSVKRDVEGFISLLRNVYTRKCAFYWGEMVYVGVLISANATYNMFDPNGNPTRATIDLQIMLADSNNPVLVTNGLSEGPWLKYYEKAFSDKDSVSMGRKLSKVSNLLGFQ